MNQSNLTPQQQALAFLLAKQAGSQPTSGGISTDTPDQGAQMGVGQMDSNTLQQLFGGQSPTASLQQQEGDQIHPADAIQHISGQMFGPQSPAGVSQATGPQLVMKNGQLTLPEAGHSPVGQLLGLFGVKQNTPVNTPNYYEAAKNAGIEKFLPSGLAQMPDGTPFVGPESFTKALTAQRTTAGQGTETYHTLDQLTAMGFTPDEGRLLLAANPNGVSSKETSTKQSAGRLTATKEMADARATMAGVAKLGQALKVGGFDAAQPMAESANKNIGVIERSQKIIDQIVAQGGKANVRQQAELSGNLAVLTAGGQGQLTDQRMNEFMPDSAMKKYGGWKEYFTNEQAPIDFTGFLPQMQDLLIRERDANVGVSNAASQLGINIMGATGQKGQATAIAGARNNTPLVGSNAPTQLVTPPNQPQQSAPVQPHYRNPDDVKAAYQAGKINLVQAKALTKAFNQGK